MLHILIHRLNPEKKMKVFIKKSNQEMEMCAVYK